MKARPPWLPGRAAAILVLAVATLAPFGLTAAPASAAPPVVSGVVRIPATSDYSTHDYKHAIAECPPGKGLTGTGHYVYGADGEIALGHIRVNGSSTTPPTGVSVYAYELHPDVSPGPWSVTAYAICADMPAGLVKITQPSAGGWSNSKSVTAHCPPGKVLTGAGFVFPPGLNASHGVIVDDLRPSGGNPPTAVTVTAYESDPVGQTNSWHMNADAICANPLDGLVVVPRITGSSVAGVKSTTVPCPAGSPTAPYALVGTGYEVNGGVGGVNVRRTSPNGSASVTPTSFMVTAHGFTGTWTVTGYAICARRYGVIAPG